MKKQIKDFEVNFTEVKSRKRINWTLILFVIYVTILMLILYKVCYEYI